MDLYSLFGPGFGDLVFEVCHLEQRLLSGARSLLDYIMYRYVYLIYILSVIYLHNKCAIYIYIHNIDTALALALLLHLRSIVVKQCILHYTYQFG